MGATRDSIRSGAGAAFGRWWQGVRCLLTMGRERFPSRRKPGIARNVAIPVNAGNDRVTRIRGHDALENAVDVILGDLV